MNKILVLSMVLALSTTISFAASSYGDALKNAVKQDIATIKKETKESVKKDIEAKSAANQKAAQEKKAQKLKEINAKITELNKEKVSIQNAKDITNTEKTFKTKMLDKQLKYYNDQLEALK